MRVMDPAEGGEMADLTMRRTRTSATAAGEDAVGVSLHGHRKGAGGERETMTGDRLGPEIPAGSHESVMTGGLPGGGDVKGTRRGHRSNGKPDHATVTEAEAGVEIVTILPGDARDRVIEVQSAPGGAIRVTKEGVEREDVETGDEMRGDEMREDGWRC